MPRYLLDTDTTTLLRRGHPEVARRVSLAVAGDVAVSVITIEEQLTGWYTYLRRATQPSIVERGYKELADTVRFYSRISVEDFTAAAISRTQSLLAQKLNIAKADLKIAAIALEACAVVVTRNVRDFGRVPNLTVEDWSLPVPPPTLPVPPAPPAGP